MCRIPTNKTVSKRNTQFTQADDAFEGLEKKKKSRKPGLSNDTSAAQGMDDYDIMSRDEVVTNPAKMFVYPGRPKEQSSTINLMLSKDDSYHKLIEPMSPPMTADEVKSTNSKGSGGRSKKQKPQTIEELMNADDASIPGVRPMKNLELLKHTEPS
jgi:hypothetical protein